MNNEIDHEIDNKEIKHFKRSAERELAFRSIFALPFHETSSDAIESIDNFLIEEAENKTEDSLEIEAGNFTRALVAAVVNQQVQIDAYIQDYIRKDWSLARLPNVEKAVLRLAIAEMRYLHTPREIAINEAVKLVKKYGDEDAYRFVNGILHHFADDHVKKRGKK